MTVIAIRDGIMAVDSLISGGGMKFGMIKKWRDVPDVFGGGFIASTGACDVAQAGMDAFCASGQIINDNDTDECRWVHMMADGAVREFYHKGPWLSYDADFYAYSASTEFTFGALAAGATAEEAAELTCQYIDGCGGDVHVLSIPS